MTLVSKWRDEMFARTLFSIVLVMVLVSCGGGSSSGAGTTGSLQVRLTDAHTNNVSEVNIAIVSLQAKPAGSPVVQIPVLFNTVDLLTLQNSSALLANAIVPAGHYEFIMVKLDQGQSGVVEAGQAKPLMIASEEVKVLGGFDVLENGDTTVLLDFDAERSLIKQGNGQWQMKPVILMESVNAVPAN